MKFIYITDPHISAKGPSSRTDNYLDTCIAKLGEVAGYAQANHIPYIILGGDMFDSPSQNYTTLLRVMNLLAGYDLVTWYINVGNHDLFGWNPDTYQRTALRFLEYLPNVRVLKDRTLFEFPRSSCTPSHIYLYPIWSKYEREGDVSALNVEFPSQSKRYIIVLPHTMLVEKSFVSAHVSIEQIDWERTGDMILGSHYHPGYETQIINRTANGVLDQRIVMNPGSLLRTSKSSEQHVPSFLVIEIDGSTFGVKSRKIPLACALPDPFKEDAPIIPENEALSTPRFEEFMRELANVTFDIDDTDPRTVAAKIAHEGKFSKEVLQRVIKNLDMAMAKKGA